MSHWYWFGSRCVRGGFLLAASVMALAALTGSGCPGSTQQPQAGVTDVTIRNVAYSSNHVTIKKGESVRWTNQDAIFHTATSGNPGDADAGSVFDTGDIAPGSSVTVTFDNVGEFTYFCRHHPTMMFGARVSVTQ